MGRDDQADSGRQGASPLRRETMSMDVPDPIMTLADKANDNPAEMGTTASDFAGSTEPAHRAKRTTEDLFGNP